MLEPRQRFIDLATRPLAGNPADHALAQGELMDRLAHARPEDGDDLLEAATRRLEEKTPRPAWQSVLGFFGTLVLAAAVLFPVLRAAWQEMKELNPLYYLIPVHRDHNDEWEEQLTAGLDEEQRRFLILNTNGIGRETQADWILQARKALPEGPAEFEELILALGSNALVGDLVTGHGGKIDPGNAVWALYAAMQDGRTSLSGSTTPGYTRISQRSGYERTWKQLGETLLQPRLESHIPGRTVRRLEMLPTVVDLRTMANRRHFAGRQRYLSDDSGLALTWVARAEELAKAGDREALKAWIASWEKFTIRQLQPDQSAFQGGEFTYRTPMIAKSLAAHATSLGLTEEITRLERWTKASEAIQARLMISSGPRRYAMTVSGGRDFFIADEAEFEPGRRAEFALADRYFALTAACIFTFFAFLAALEVWRRPGEIRGMALGLSPLLQRADFAWLAGLGIAVPLAWHVLVTRFTPLACRDLALTEWDMIPAFSQAGGSVLLSVCLLLQTARWRIARRGGFLALRPPVLWPGWSAAVVAALFVPSLGVVRYLTKWEEEFLLLGSTAAGLPLLWLLWRGGAIAFGPRAASLGGVLTCRLLFPAFLTMAALLLAAMPLLKSEERRWVARDTVGGTDPAGSGLGRLEARTQEALRAELLEAMK